MNEQQQFPPPTDFRETAGRTSHFYKILDVFTDSALSGNALAVFPDADGVPEAMMPKLARELNLSETVFVMSPREGGDRRLRIFTPGAELPFAGHPVLGTAVMCALEKGCTKIEFECVAGKVPLTIEPVGPRSARGWMEQPVPTWSPLDPELSRRVLDALGLKSSQLPLEEYVNGPHQTFVELASQSEVERLSPDFSRLGELDLLVSCYHRSGDRVKTRMFAPSIGINEDPATGGAAGPLAVHLSRHAQIEFGAEITISQGAEIGRPSQLKATAHGSGNSVAKVEVGGIAVLVGSGTFDL